MKTQGLVRSVVLSVGGVCVLSIAGAASGATFTEMGTAVLGGVDYESRSVSFADIDNDGDLDMMFQGGSGAFKLFTSNLTQTGNLTFTNAFALLPSGVGPSWSAAWGDYNGDGNVDVFIGQSNIGASGDVLRNDGVSGFTNASTSTGLNDPGFHQNVAWADIDNDRDLDLVIGMEGPEKHEIYLQGAGSNFTAVGAAVGMQVPHGTKAYGMAMGDTDGDGDLDIYISTCIGSGTLRNNFFENQLAQTGTLSFIDIADTNGTQFMPNSYGSEFLDFDDDGDLDLFMVGADGNKSKIFRNDGNNQFTDVDTITGQDLLSNTGRDLNGGRAVDYDNDGDLDLFFHDHLSGGGSNAARKLYRNDGNWQFTDVTVAEGLHETNKGSYDSSWADLDRDGDQDLVATTASGTDERVYLSDVNGNGNHWLYIELEGPTYNTTGLGATVYATINEGTPQERTLRREANTNAGTFNQSDLPVHFGLGTASLIDNLRIVWPDGRVQQLFDVSVDQYLGVSYADMIDGDLDGDGFVGIADLNIVLGAWNQSFPSRNNQADPSGDGFVGIEDLNIVLGNWNTGTPPVASLPEPASGSVLLVLGLCAGYRRVKTL